MQSGRICLITVTPVHTGVHGIGVVHNTTSGMYYGYGVRIRVRWCLAIHWLLQIFSYKSTFFSTRVHENLDENICLQFELRFF